MTSDKHSFKASGDYLTGKIEVDGQELKHVSGFMVDARDGTMKVTLDLGIVPTDLDLKEVEVVQTVDAQAIFNTLILASVEMADAFDGEMIGERTQLALKKFRKTVEVVSALLDKPKG